MPDRPPWPDLSSRGPRLVLAIAPLLMTLTACGPSMGKKVAAVPTTQKPRAIASAPGLSRTPEPGAPSSPLGVEALRASCIHGRRLICGRVLQIVPGGLVVDSGYTSLLRPPLTQTWVAPATVSATRDSNGIESEEPGAICIGIIELTDLPKSPAAHLFDYVLIQGYPAGQAAYHPVPSITKAIRRFSAGLETAVNLSAHDNGARTLP